MKLINADELEPDTEWSDYYDGFTSYSQSQINEAEEVKAIPLDKVKQAREKIENLETQIQSYHNDDPMISQADVLSVLDKLIEELPPVKPVACIAKVNFSKEDMQEIVDKKVKEMVARKKGKWMYVGDNCFACSECGEVYTVDQFNHINNYCDNRYPKACPNCAIEMESEE